MVWIMCELCQDWYCTVHDKHAFECACPPIEEWGDSDPYSDDFPGGQKDE